MNEKQMKKADFISSIVLITFGITVTGMAVKMPRLEDKGINPYTAPGVVPGVLGIIILLLAFIMLVRTIRRADYLPRISKGQLKSAFQNNGMQRLLVALALCLFYALVLVGRIPYLPATFLFIFGFILSFDLKFDRIKKSAKRIILIALAQALITSVVISAAFQYLFLVDLP